MESKLYKINPTVVRVSASLSRLATERQISLLLTKSIRPEISMSARDSYKQSEIPAGDWTHSGFYINHDSPDMEDLQTGLQDLPGLCFTLGWDITGADIAVNNRAKLVEVGLKLDKWFTVDPNLISKNDGAFTLQPDQYKNILMNNSLSAVWSALKAPTIDFIERGLGFDNRIFSFRGNKGFHDVIPGVPLKYSRGVSGNNGIIFERTNDSAPEIDGIRYDCTFGFGFTTESDNFFRIGKF